MQAKISVAALGGTISMTHDNDGQGITSKLGAKDLLNQIPDLSNYAEIHAQTLFKQSSCSLTFAQLFDTLNWANEQIQSGADGVVISQGTDTIEQTAFFFDLFWPHEAPLVVMGAMRSPQAVGFDGLANLLGAVIVAADVQSRNRGVLVVMNDTVHEARWVTKTNTVRLDTFQSPIHGPVGLLSEGKVAFLRDTRRPKVFLQPLQYDKQILIIEHGLSDDPQIIDWAMNSHKSGIVISAVGAGHVSEAMRHAIVLASKKIPVIICSRTGSGATTEAVYGYIGSEIDLQKHGCLMGGWLPAIKARLLLLAASWNDMTKDELKTYLDDWKVGH